MGDNEHDQPADRFADAIETDRDADADRPEPETLDEAVSNPEPTERS